MTDYNSQTGGIKGNRPSGFTSFMTPNTNTSRQYDQQIEGFGVQMGFGAVPPRVTAA